MIHDGILKLCNTYVLSPGKFTVFQKLSRLLKPNFKKGEKIGIKIEYDRGEFKKRKIEDNPNITSQDEIEATELTSIASIRNWIVKNYICIEYFSKCIIESFTSEIKTGIDVNFLFLFL